MPPALTTPPAPAPARRGRIPWALLPLLLGLLYAGLHAALRRDPDLEGMVPADAFVTWRYRDLAAYDDARATPPPATGSPAPLPSVALGAELNLPGLPGVDRTRPLVEAWLDPTRRADPKFFVLPVEDEGAMQRAFRSPDLRDRHARHVVPHGAWAAVAADLDAARRAGRGRGLLPPADGADWAVEADWPRLVDHALLPHVATTPPYRDLLAAWGFDPATARRVTTPEGTVLEVQGGRVPRVRDAWARVGLSVHGDPRGELAAPAGLPPGPALRLWAAPAASSPLRALLAAAVAAPASEAGTALVPGGEDAEWSVVLRDAAARRVGVHVLADAGLAFPPPLASDDFAALRLAAEGPLAVRAFPAPGLLPAWTLALAGPPQALPDLTSLGLPTPAAAATAPLAAGAAKVLMPYGGESPAGEVARVDAGRGVAVLAAGVGAAATAARWAAEISAAPPTPWAPTVGGLVPLAELRVRGGVLHHVLGRALTPGSLLARLGGAERLVGRLATDGTRVVLDLWPVRPTPR